MSQPDQQRVDFDKWWNYDNPAETRDRFMELLHELNIENDDDYTLQLRTQIARTWGLDGQFEKANEVLDLVESKLSENTPVARMRYLLERGRTLRSSGKSEAAQPLFVEAYEYGKSAELDYLTIDAAHMVALVVKKREERIEWSLKGIALAEKSADQRCRHWLGSIYNNVGWDYHDASEYDSALVYFDRALQARVEEGNDQAIEIAKWCVARCYRSLGRNEEALELQLALYETQLDEERVDGYVCEELGELYLLFEEPSTAAKYFGQADELLSQDKWFVENNAERLARIRRLANSK